MKKHLVSFGISFLVGFCLVFVDQIDNLSLETLKDGSYIGVLFGALRAGVKSVVETFLRKHTTLME